MAVFQKREGIMLAYPAELRRIQAFPLMEMASGEKERKFFHQPKLNGERGRTDFFNGLPYIFSSYNNEFKYLDKIQQQIGVLCDSLQISIKLDGEIYKHGWSRERIDSALRRTKNRNPDVDALEYHIFDYQHTSDLQFARLQKLGTLEQVINTLKLDALKIVPYGICSEVDYVHHCGCYCEDGYEGIILRNPFAVYEEKRVPGLLKFKPTETDLYEIVAVNEATTSDTNEPKGMVGSFTVKAKDEPGDNVTFDVGAGKLKHEQRIAYWNDKDWCIGRMLLVKHEFLRTTNQVPIAAVTVDIV